MSRVKIILFTVCQLIIIFHWCCKKKLSDPNLKTSYPFADSVWENQRRSLDSFVSQNANREWPEILLPDTINDFANICDTFYPAGKTEIKTYVLYKINYDQNRWFYNRHICFESSWFGFALDPAFIINCPIQFTNCTFYFRGFRSLHNVTCKSYALFQNNIFPDSSIIENAHFENGVDFLDTSQSGHLPLFVGSIFSHGISFSSGEMVERASIGGLGATNFYSIGCRFHSDIVFSNCQITGTLSFRYCSFGNNSSLIMEGTSLPDTLDLSNTKITGILDLTGMRTKNKLCYINLVNADIDKVRFRYSHFKLYFPKQSPDNLELKDLISSTYERVLNNFKINGLTDSYEKLDIEYSKWKSKSDWVIKVSDIWWKFGYQKWRILLFTIGFILLFSTINYRRYNVLQTVYPVERLKWNNIQYSPINIIYVLRKFLAVYLFTGLIFFRLSIDFKNLNFRPMRYVVLIIFEYTIGLICTGFLINWILKG